MIENVPIASNPNILLHILRVLFLPLIIAINSPVDTLINEANSGGILNYTELRSKTVAQSYSGGLINAHHHFHKLCISFIINF